MRPVQRAKPFEARVSPEDLVESDVQISGSNLGGRFDNALINEEFISRLIWWFEGSLTAFDYNV